MQKPSELETIRHACIVCKWTPVSPTKGTCMRMPKKGGWQKKDKK